MIRHYDISLDITVCVEDAPALPSIWSKDVVLWLVTQFWWDGLQLFRRLTISKQRWEHCNYILCMWCHNCFWFHIICFWTLARNILLHVWLRAWQNRLLHYATWHCNNRNNLTLSLACELSKCRISKIKRTIMVESNYWAIIYSIMYVK